MSELRRIAPEEVVAAYRATGKKPVRRAYFKSTKYNINDLNPGCDAMAVVKSVDCCCPLAVLSVHLGMDPAKDIQERYNEEINSISEYEYEPQELAEEKANASIYALSNLLEDDGGAVSYLAALGYSNDYLTGFVEGVDGAIPIIHWSGEYQAGLEDGRLAWKEVVKEIGVADEATQAS